MKEPSVWVGRQSASNGTTSLQKPPPSINAVTVSAPASAQVRTTLVTSSTIRHEIVRSGIQVGSLVSCCTQLGPLSMKHPDADNASPDTTANSRGPRNDLRFPSPFIRFSCLEERKLQSRTGADSRAIHLAFRRTECDKLHRLNLGGLTARDLSQYRCRRHYLKQLGAVRPDRRDRNLVPLVAAGFFDVERRRPRLASAGEITL